MPSATITSKGQITIPKKIRDRLNLKSGDSVDFEVESDDRVVMIPSKHKPEVVYGILHREGAEAVSSEEMEDEVTDYFKQKYKKQ